MFKKLLFAAGVLIISGSNVFADSKTFVTYRSLTVETALELAKATLDACRKMDYQIAVAVVDRGGNTQVILRDRFAGPHTGETARGLPGVAAIGGGVLIQAAGSLVGGVGVSGAPGGTVDDQCAKQGLAKIQDKLDF